MHEIHKSPGKSKLDGGKNSRNVKGLWTEELKNKIKLINNVVGKINSFHLHTKG